MGMYTLLSLGVEFKKDTPKEIIETIQFMVDGNADELSPGLAHPLFMCDRWGFMLRCDSYYFDWQTKWTVTKDYLYGIDEPMIYLTGNSNLKNYDGEIDNFLNWIAPYLKTEGFLGFKQYEEQQYPTLIFLDNQELTFFDTENAARLMEGKDDEHNFL